MNNLTENTIYHIAIVDDSIEDAECLKRVIDKYFEKKSSKQYEVCIYQNSNTLIWEIEDRKYFDVYFLYVEMAEQT